ncbi:lactonase family protein [Chryseobacterium cheonjiense]|uniref:Beta-propeller fold lactonase family protein n=1 Tax=Chryseobacterium cheonjiense TaxID=2728845 RepID=A0A7Y0FJX7_9FLAO|nr:beta-propeller fold lactonase family protein [Chryseobacterium cheonjiense]NML59049.1 beta-propeller fold lactonase family protein [Chryseobacterium cheonjiense]
MIKRISILSISVLLLSLFLVSCSDDNDTIAPTPEKDMGYVFTMTNSNTSNDLLVYSRDENGNLSLKSSIATMGIGSGGGLGSQGALTLSTDRKFLFVVNAGDNSISSFTVAPNNVTLVGKYNLVGQRPVSVAQRGNLVYVLNSAGTTGAASIEGFTLNGSTGALSPIANSSTQLSLNTNAAQISFVYDNVVVIAERATNLLTSYVLNTSSVPTNKQSFPSQAPQPFGFAVSSGGKIYVTEASASSSVSSYSVSNTGGITNISTLTNNQGGACWAVLNKTESIVYSTNAGGNTISSFNITSSGMLSATQIAFNMGAGNGPNDAGLSSNGNYLYVLAGGSDKIYGYKVDANSLTSVPGATMFVPGAAFGLAAY